MKTCTAYILKINSYGEKQIIFLMIANIEKKGQRYNYIIAQNNLKI